jgi:hypothetical protein
VEVHDLTVTGTPRVKWSRENAHVATHVLEIMNAGTTIRVESLGRDDVLRFENGDWVEIIRDSDEMAGTPGVMRQVTVDDANQTLSIAALDPTVFPDGPVNATDHMRVIRWDQSGSALTADGLIEVTPAKPSFLLGNGIEITFNVITGARSGDYWCFAARTADGDIDPLEQAPPLGIHHHFCKLAIIEADGTIHDCRPQFPGLTELTSLFYVSGDGQEALPGQALPKPIQVGVANGKRPVVGANVRFRVAGGNGNLTGGAASGIDINILTDTSGVASCVWTLDGANQSQQVEATLADGSHLPVRFNATVSQPGGAEPGVHVQKISVGGDPLRNDTEVTVTQLTKGITISCDDALFKGSVLNKPVCFVTLEMPFPLNTEDIQLWGDPVIGFQPLILAATVSSELESIFWLVTKQCEEWLGKLFETLVKQKREVTRVLARLTVKGNFIWSEKDPNLYLDGEVFGVAASGGAVTATKLPSGDSRRGGDLEMWFWLVEKKAPDVRVTIKPGAATVVAGKQVEFTVDVEGTADKKVDVALNPPTRAGTIEQVPQRPNTWIYTAPTAPILNQVRVIATNSAAPLPAVAVVNILDDQQGIEVTIAPAGAILEPGDSQEFTVTVKGGDAAKVSMSVNGVPNGNPQVGVLNEKSTGVWTYLAPGTEQTVKIRATSQADATKFAEVNVTIRKLPNPRDRERSPRGRTRRSRT